MKSKDHERWVRPRKNRTLNHGESSHREKRARTRSPIRRVVMGGLLACLLAIVVIGGREGIEGIRHWTEIQQITVIGLDHISRQDIVTRLAIAPDESLLFIDSDTLSEQLTLHPWIRSVTFDRVFPHTLVVDVTEREPAAVFESSQSPQLLDAEGYRLPGKVTKQDNTLPIVFGISSSHWNTSPGGGSQRAKRGIHLAKLLSHHFPGRPRVDVSHAYTTIVELPHVRFQFGPEAEPQWERFMVLFPTLKDEFGKRPKEVDLRFPQKIILRQRTL